MADKELDWKAWEEKVKRLRKAYNELPLKNGWFVISKLNRYATRYIEGERSQELYDSVMNMKV